MIRTMTMNVSEVDLQELKAQATEINKDGSFYIEDDSDSALCKACKEWASIVRYYDKDGNETETLSDCCSANIHIF